jgi:hypothetical protein
LVTENPQITPKLGHSLFEEFVLESKSRFFESDWAGMVEIETGQLEALCYQQSSLVGTQKFERDMLVAHRQGKSREQPYRRHNTM